MEASFESTKTVVRRLGPKAVAFAAVMAAFVFFRGIPSPRNHFGWTTTVVLAALAMLVMLAVVVRANPWPRLVPAKVTANARELVVGERTLSCARIRSAVLVPGEGPGKPFVRVMPAAGLPIEIGVPSSEEGNALLRAIGFDASHRAVELRTFSLRFFTFATMAMTPFVIPITLIFHPPTAMMMLGIGVVMVAAYLLSLGKVGVGADGIAIRRWGRTRFIKQETIEDVRPFKRLGVAIRTKTGDEVRIPLGSGGFQRDEVDKDVAAFIERVEESMRVYKSGELESTSALLDRGSHDLREWLRTLRALGAGSNVTLRTAAIGSDQLVRVVENPAARPIDRAAAAVAIQSSDDKDAKARVRVALDATADDKLRAALDAATDGDDQRIEAALGELERE